MPPNCSSWPCANFSSLGYGYHGDFISGWDADFLQAAVEQCTDGSGMVQACPLFTVLSEDEQRKCRMTLPPSVANEKVTGIIGESLPGGLAIAYGPGPAVVAQAVQPAPEPASTSAGLPGGVFKELPSETPQINALGAADTPSSSPTPTPTPTPSDPPVPAGYELLRTDYVTNGNVVSKIVVIETVEYVMMATETVTVTSTFGADKARRELHHLHGRRHGMH